MFKAILENVFVFYFILILSIYVLPRKLLKENLLTSIGIALWSQLLANLLPHFRINLFYGEETILLFDSRHSITFGILLALVVSYIFEFVAPMGLWFIVSSIIAFPEIVANLNFLTGGLAKLDQTAGITNIALLSLPIWGWYFKNSQYIQHIIWTGIFIYFGLIPTSLLFISHRAITLNRSICLKCSLMALCTIALIGNWIYQFWTYGPNLAPLVVSMLFLTFTVYLRRITN